MVEQIHIIRKEKQNSYEHGKAGNRVKIYFDDIKKLELELLKIKEMEKRLEEHQNEKA